MIVSLTYAIWTLCKGQSTMLSERGTGGQTMSSEQETFLNKLADLLNSYGVTEVRISDGRVIFENDEFEIAFNKYEDGTFYNCYGSLSSYDSPYVKFF